MLIFSFSVRFVQKVGERLLPESEFVRRSLEKKVKRVND
jgi:hypothetical protein